MLAFLIKIRAIIAEGDLVTARSLSVRVEQRTLVFEES
jgi:hypothetical protein